MQKKLLTMAVAAALAAPGMVLAQSSVQLYGSIDTSILNYKLSSSTNGLTPSVSRMVVYSSGLRTVLGVRGQESIGGGTTVWFQMESTVPGDVRKGNDGVTGAFLFGGRNTAVGLRGGWGDVFAGQWDTPYKVNMYPVIIPSSQSAVGVYGNILGNPTGAGNTDTTGTVVNPNCQNLPATAAPTAANPLCTEQEGGPTGFNRRAGNSINYWSPKFANTLFKFLYQAPESKASAGANPSQNPRLWSTSLTYEAGPVLVGLAYEKHNDFQFTGGTDKAWSATATYELPIKLTLGGYYERLTTNGPAAGFDVNARNWALLADYRLPGPGRLILAYAKAKDPEGAGAVANAGGKAYTLGYRHGLSKRTLVYAFYGKMDNNPGATRAFIAAPLNSSGTGSAVAAGQDATGIGVGITHTF